MEDIDTTLANVNNLGRDLLFVLMWVGAWGTLELFIKWLSANHKIQLVVYLCLFVAGFVALIFVNVPEVDGKVATVNPDLSRSLPSPLRSLHV